MSGEVITRKNLRRRRTTRSRIIFYEGIVSVLHIGSLTTRRCLVVAVRRVPLHPFSIPSTLRRVPPSCHRPISFFFTVSALLWLLRIFPLSPPSETFYRFLSSQLLVTLLLTSIHVSSLPPPLVPISSSRSRSQAPHSCISLLFLRPVGILLAPLPRSIPALSTCSAMFP